MTSSGEGKIQGMSQTDVKNAEEEKKEGEEGEKGGEAKNGGGW